MKRREFLAAGTTLLGLTLSEAIAQAQIQFTPVPKSHPLLTSAARIKRLQGFHSTSIKEWSNEVLKYTDKFGRAPDSLQSVLYTFELEYSRDFDEATTLAYQGLAGDIGSKVLGDLRLPKDARSLWMLGNQPFANYQSTDSPPKTADYVIIGAGLTGASTAYHLLSGASSGSAQAGSSVVLLDASDPACEATGKNGGNFELIPESFMGTYEGLPKERLKFLQDVYPDMDRSLLLSLAIHQARAVFSFCFRNSKRMTHIARQPEIECDFSPNGWLRIAGTNVEENGLREEVQFAKAMGIEFELWPAEKIRSTMKIPAKFLGRMAPTSGNYHPIKFVNSVISKLLKKGLSLYTRTQVQAVVPQGKNRVLVKTNRGEILAKRVVLATNAFSSQLFSELDVVRTYQSQVLNMEHVENTIRNMTVTENQGDLYYNFPLSKQYTDSTGTNRGTIHAGGGVDRPIGSATQCERTLATMNEIKFATDVRFPNTRGQPPSRSWTGPMGFTRDRLPIIGPLVRRDSEIPEITIAVGFNGYGGSYCIEAGYCAAYYASEGSPPPDLEADVFSHRRVASFPGIKRPQS